jgi:carboxyl-terminal processing protease
VTNRNLLFWTPALTVTAAAVGVAAWNASDRSGDYKFFDDLVDIKHLISTRYVDSVDEQKLKEGAIKGMVEALEDPYTVFVPASEQREFNKNLTGEYVGIGASVNMSTGWLTIVSPLEDSPAYRAGMMPEDKVLEINGTSTQGKSVEECVDLLMGDAGTPVILKVDRKGQTLDVTIIREKIKTRSVKGVHRDDKNPEQWDFTLDASRRIGYIRITQFTPKLTEEVRAALASLGAEKEAGKGGLQGLILDLRSNPGGLLSEAEAIADLFLREGIIVSTRGRAHPEDVTRAVAVGTLPDFPIIIMLNGESASASEVLAGALSDNKRATILGTRSFGKGSVQSLVQIGEPGASSELKMTEQGYYLPSGRSITRKDDSVDWGVDPTPGFYVPMTDAENIEMLKVRRDLELLQLKDANAAAITGDVPAPRTTDWENPEWVITSLKDPQLTAALRAMQARVDTSTWKTTGSELPQRGEIAAGELTKARQWRERLIRELMRAEKRIDALDTVTKDVKTTDSRDFWPDTTDLTDGTMEVKDKDGKVIATLKITGNNLERWLLDADVEMAPAPH